MNLSETCTKPELTLTTVEKFLISSNSYLKNIPHEIKDLAGLLDDIYACQSFVVRNIFWEQHRQN